MSVITISRQYGIFIDEKIRDLAKEKDYKFYSHEIVREVSKLFFEGLDSVKKYYSMNNFKSLKLFLHEMLQSFEKASSLLVAGSVAEIPEFLPIYYPPLEGINQEDAFKEKESYINCVKKVIQKIYENEKVVIVGRGSHIILKDKPKVLNLRIVEEDEARVEKVKKFEQLNTEEAEKRIREIDRNRCNYIKYFYDTSIDNALLYDLVLNISRLGEQKVLEIINGYLK